jgi:HEPN domain-containing protein
VAEREKTIRKFERAAEHRLKAARFLHDHGYHHDAVYLGGYAVECALKALILRRTARRDHEGMMEKLAGVGRKGHDFEYLRSALQSKGVAMSRIPRGDNVWEFFQAVQSWSVSMRYEPSEVEAEEAKRFLAATEYLVQWANRS